MGILEALVAIGLNWVPVSLFLAGALLLVMQAWFWNRKLRAQQDGAWLA